MWGRLTLGTAIFSLNCPGSVDRSLSALWAVTFTALGMTVYKLVKAFITTGLSLGNILQLIFAVLLLILGVIVAVQGIRKLSEKTEKVAA